MMIRSAALAALLTLGLLISGCSSDGAPATTDGAVDGAADQAAIADQGSDASRDSLGRDSLGRDSLAPDSLAPDSLAPDAAAPDTAAPDTTAPDVLVPDVLVPDVLAPDVLAPDVLAPDTLAPDTLAPDTAPPVCPILTYVCATGCCPVGSEVVSDTRAQYPDLIVKGGNVYVTYAIPNSGVWQTGVAIYDKTSASWRRQKFQNGYTAARLRLTASGRLHHHYARSSGAITYQYSDNKGLTWQQLGTISGKLMIGGACGLDADSLDRPHLICGFEEAYGYRGIPRYIRHNGASWLSSLENFQGSMGRQITVRVGFADRPHLVHTYGSTAADVHYTFYTGSQWISEGVPYGANLQAHPDRTPGFELGAQSTAHIAFIARDKTAKTYAAYYARRTLPNTWIVEEAIPAAVLGASNYGDAHIALDAHGEPVIFTSTGAGARRSPAGTWKTFQSGKAVDSLAVEGDYAYITYPVPGASYYLQRLHLTLVDIR